MSELQLSAEMALVRRAHAGDPRAFRRCLTAHQHFVNITFNGGRATHEDFDLSRADVARALFRVATLRVERERESFGAKSDFADVIKGIVFDDVYWVQALLLGHPRAWRAFDRLLRRVVHSLQVSGYGHELHDLEEELCGTFYTRTSLQRFRASGALGSWVRIVVRNHATKRLRSRAGPTVSALSSFEDPERESSPTIEAEAGDEALDQAHDLRLLRRALAMVVEPVILEMLPSERRLLLCDYDAEVQQSQLALEDGVQASTTSRRLKAARQSFRRILRVRMREVLGHDAALDEGLLAQILDLGPKRQDSMQGEPPRPLPTP